MLLLNSITSKLQLLTTAAGAIDVQVSYIDRIGGTETAGPLTNLAQIITAATTDIVPVPAASTARNVRDITVRNVSATIANVVAIIHTDGTNAREKYRGSLGIGETLCYDQNGVFQLYDVTGALKVIAVASGSFIKHTMLIAGTTHVLSTATRAVKVELKGGGGGGGGTTSAAVSAAAGAGGGEGGTGFKHVLGVSPGVTLTYSLGAAGAAGSTAGGGGGAGGTTSIVINGITYNSAGGQGGPGMLAGTAVLFSAGPSGGGSGTALDQFIPGTSGGSGLILSGTVGAAGAGARGNGTRINGGSGLGVPVVAGGGGGGGGLVLNGLVAQAGGLGGSGYIFIEEFT